MSARPRRTRILRAAGYLAAPAILGAMFALEPFAAPCADFIDGPCQENWASDAQWTLLPAFLLAAVGAILLGLNDLFAWLKRRRSATPH